MVLESIVVLVFEPLVDSAFGLVELLLHVQWHVETYASFSFDGEAYTLGDLGPGGVSEASVEASFGL